VRASQASDPQTLQSAKRRIRGAVVAVVVFSFFINLLMFVAPLYMLQVYDRVLTSRNETTLVMLTILAIGALALFGGLELIRSRVLVRMGARLDELLSEATFRAAFRRTLRDQRPGYGQLLRDLDQIREFISGSGLTALCDAPWVPLFLALVFFFHPLLGLVATVAAVVIFTLALSNELLTRGPIRSASRETNRANTFVETALRNSQAAAAMGMTPNLEQRWRGYHRGALGDQARASDRAGTILATSKAMRMGFQVAILGTGAYLVLQQATTPGTMIAASIVMGRALAPVEQAVGQWRAFVNARTAYDRLRNMIGVAESPASMPLPAPEGRLTVERAVVVPPGGKTPVVKGVSFELEPGEMLGIIGPSGAGKSTLARSLLGVWPLGNGHVRLDGAEIWDWESDELGPYLGYLPQDIELFDGTASENIARFGEVDHDKVVAAAQLAGVHEMILRLPDGYDTWIGPGGQVLSGGQQRGVALARALYGDVRLVVMDEPNANLDQEGEQQVLKALSELKERKVTTVVITHRPQMLASADRIITLRDGQVAAAGPRDEMFKRFVGAVGSDDRRGSGQSPGSTA
jgi:PrtD family type I secretion system ABC transporter